MEGSFTGVLDFVHELALLGNIYKQVSTSGLRTEAPNLLGIVGVPAVLILKNLVADLNVLFGIDLLIFDGLG